MFSDTDIAQAVEDGRIKIDGVESIWERLQPASLDLTLGNEFLAPRAATPNGATVIDFKHDTSDLLARTVVTETGYFPLAPGGYALGTTVESITLPDNIVANVAGKSSLARLGLAVHITAGLVDPSWAGMITLEFFNHSPYWMKLWPNMPIAQISFQETVSPSMKGYVGKYTGQNGPTASRYFKNWDAENDRWF